MRNNNEPVTVVAAVLKMADHLVLEKFENGNAQAWISWLEDYCLFAQMKKWNTDKLVTNLRFFVSGDVKECVRHVCAACPAATLDLISAEVLKLLGGMPDPLVAVRRLDSVVYEGNVMKTLLAIEDLIQFAYPTVSDKAHKDQLTWIHLQKVIPTEYQRDLTKAGITKLDTAVERVRAFERADASIQSPPAGLYRTQTSPAIEKTDSQGQRSSSVVCYTCGLSGHIRALCPFRHDICGNCERRGHLSTVCRGRPMQARGANQSRGRSLGNGRQSVPWSLGQTGSRTRTVAPLMWTGTAENQAPVQSLPPQPHAAPLMWTAENQAPVPSLPPQLLAPNDCSTGAEVPQAWADRGRPAPSPRLEDPLPQQIQNQQLVEQRQQQHHQQQLLLPEWPTQQ